MLSCLEASREGRSRFPGGERTRERGGKSEDAAVAGEGEGEGGTEKSGGTLWCCKGKHGGGSKAAVNSRRN